MVAYTFNPRIWEVETGVIWLGGKRNIRPEETGAQSWLRMKSEDSLGQDRLFGLSIGEVRTSEAGHSASLILQCSPPDS